MTLTISIDWNHDGDYADTHDNITPYVLAAEWSLGRDTPEAILPPDGIARLTLDNGDRRFSPDYDSSPLYGSVQPGRRVKIEIDAGSGPEILWQGWLSSVEIGVGRYGTQVALLTCLQGFDRLHSTPAALPLQIDQSADEIVDLALSRVHASAGMTEGWLLGAGNRSELDQNTQIYQPADQLTDETGKTLFPYVGDNWSSETSVYAVIAALVEAEHGVFWQSRDGTFNFRNRHFWATSTTIAETLDLDSDAITAEYAFGRELATTVHVTCYPRAISSTTGLIWQGTDPFQVRALDERAVAVHFTNDAGLQVGVLEVEPPLPIIDYTAQLLNGFDVTAWVDVNVVVEGGTARLYIHNLLTLTVLVSISLRGKIITRFGALTLEVVDEDSLVAYGRHQLTVDLPEVADPDEAEDYARWLLGRKKSPQGFINRVVLRDRDSTWLNRMVDWTFGTRLTLSEYQTGDVAGDYFVVGERFTFSPDNGLEATFTLLPADTQPYWVVDNGLLEENSVLGY